MAKKTIEDIQVNGKKVLVRCDFNVPMDENKVITDENRLRGALPTIQYLIKNGAKVILCSHLGRPKGEFNMKYSLRPVAERLSQLLGQEVKMADDVIGESAHKLASELKDERDAGYTDIIVEYQTLMALHGLTAEEVKGVVIAYEPVWAIGTGLTATDEQANETIGAIRKAIERQYGKEVSDAVRIQYGGSMNPKNVKGLMAQPEIDGGLIGGASLKAPDFSQVVLYNK